MRVDAHTHIWQPSDTANAAAATIVSPQSEISPELLAEYLDEHKIDRAVLVQPVYPGEDNSYVAAAARRQPDASRQCAWSIHASRTRRSDCDTGSASVAAAVCGCGRAWPTKRLLSPLRPRIRCGKWPNGSASR